MADEKKFLDQTGVEYLWSKLSLEDYPNNETLITVLNAIDATKADKKFTITTPNEASVIMEEIFGEGPYTFEFTESSQDYAVAADVQFNPSNSDLEATNVQAAIDEIIHPSGTDYSRFKLRNIAIMDTVPTEINDGDIVLVYVKSGE